MAKSLNTLIRLNEWVVDERRRELSDVLKSLENLENGLQRLNKELELEQQAVQTSPNEAGFLYGNYAASVLQNRNNLSSGIMEMEEKISVAQEEMRAEFKELKVFEITKEARDDIAEKELAREEQNVLDELGQDHRRHRRQSKRD